MATAGAAAAISLALTAVSTANSIASAQAKRKFDRAQTRLGRAQAKQAEQKKLSKSLAGQAVQAAARGVAPSSGSLMRKAMAARAAAERQIRNSNSLAALDNARSSLGTRSSITNSLLNFGENAAQSGPTIAAWREE